MVMVKAELDMLLNNKTLSLMQPTYLPWLGYFNLIKNSDEFIFYTTTQLSKRSWQTRNKIKSLNSNLMLTIPIIKSESRDNLSIENAKVQNEINWQENHLKSINQCYSKAPFFEQIYPLISGILLKKSNYLIDYTIPIILSFLEVLEIQTKISFSKEINYSGKKNEALISICKEQKANKYLSVQGSKDYILNGENLFEKNNIDLLWHEYDHPKYNQLTSLFESHLSIIDSLFMLGIDGVKKII